MPCRKLLVFIFAVLVSNSAIAKSITAIALFNERAMLSVDNNDPKIISEGDTLNGVTLISSNTSEAVVEVDGQRKTLKLNGTATLSRSLGGSPATTGEKSIVLYEDQTGFFRTDGYVDGVRTNFLVDTGANIVVFSGHAADRMGIDYKKGRLGFATTASGRAQMYNITLDRLTVGGISLRNVETGVIVGGFPEIPLLGMSFLGQLEINKKGDKLTLIQR